MYPTLHVYHYFYQCAGKQIETPKTNSNSLTLSLLISKKEGANGISKAITDAPGVNFALVSSINHKGSLLHTVSVRLDKSSERDMWIWLLEKEREQLLANGLLAVVLHSGTFLWMKGKPNSGKLLPIKMLLNNRNCH